MRSTVWIGVLYVWVSASIMLLLTLFGVWAVSCLSSFISCSLAWGICDLFLRVTTTWFYVMVVVFSTFLGLAARSCARSPALYAVCLIKQGCMAIGRAIKGCAICLFKAKLSTLSTTGSFFIRLFGSKLSSDGSESLPELLLSSPSIIRAGVFVSSFMRFW